MCGRFPKLEDNVLSDLMVDVTLEEVHCSIFNMRPLKAPVVDRFHANFYQANWEVVGLSVFNLVKRTFSGEHLDPNLNITLLVLIPKIVGAETINQFRPIILCNVLYKIITKVVIRLRKAMQTLVRQNQSSFIVSLNISNKIIITH